MKMKFGLEDSIPCRKKQLKRRKNKNDNFIFEINLKERVKKINLQHLNVQLDKNV